jgi:hypothetical protein
MLEKFEFYGAPDIEQEMTEARPRTFGQAVQKDVRKLKRQKERVARGKVRRAKLIAKGIIKSKPKPTLGQKVKAGMKMVFGKWVKSEDVEQGFWDEKFDQALQERMSGVDRQYMLYQLRKKHRGEKESPVSKGKKKTDRKGKKDESRGELERELKRLESMPSPFPEVRERRIREAKKELKSISTD